MTTSALFIGWNRAYPGREALALETFNSLINLLDKQQSKGTIASFEPVVLESHGGDLNGFVLIRGDRQKLDAFQHSDEFQTLWHQGLWAVESLGVTEGFIGEGLDKRMGAFQKTTQQFGGK
jgi:hypothetical protein